MKEHLAISVKIVQYAWNYSWYCQWWFRCEVPSTPLQSRLTGSVKGIWGASGAGLVLQISMDLPPHKEVQESEINQGHSKTNNRHHTVEQTTISTFNICKWTSRLTSISECQTRPFWKKWHKSIAIHGARRLGRHLPCRWGRRQYYYY